MFRRKKPYRVCDYGDCLDAAFAIEEGPRDDRRIVGYACEKHFNAVARLAVRDSKAITDAPETRAK